MIRYAAALSLVALATPSVAQLLPAQAPDIAAALKVCVAAAGPGPVDESKIVAAGWSKALGLDKGRAVGAVPVIYGASGNAALIFLTPAQAGRNYCLVNARITTIGDYRQAEVAITGALGSAPFNREDGKLRWRAGSLLIPLEPNGSRDKPAVRVGVIYVPGENK